MVSGEGTGSKKKVHNGKEYDYVFDIDVEEGKPTLKLPYNLAESPWDAARRFLEANELPFSYYEEVANWITENTKGARIGPDALPSGGAASPQARDPLGTERRYRPGDVGSASPAQRKLPHRRYLDIVEGNAQNAVSRIGDTRKELWDAGKIGKEADLSKQDLDVLQKLVDQLHNSPRDPHPTTDQLEALLKVCTGWPTLSRVPGVALLARLAVSPSFVSSTSSGDRTIISTCAAAGLLLPMQATANNAVHTIRLLVNLFASDSGLLIVDGSFDTILNVVRPFAEQPESPAQFKALATLYLNFSVLLTSGAPSSESKSREARADVLLRDIGGLLESESPYSGDGESLFRALCALGTLLTLGDDFRRKIKMGISGTLHLVSSKTAAQLSNVKEVVQEIRDELR